MFLLYLTYKICSKFIHISNFIHYCNEFIIKYKMQIREMSLKELDIVYEIIKELYINLSYDEFEDLVYEMKEINYKMLGILDNGALISYAGVSIQTTFLDKRHLKVFDFVTSKNFNKEKYTKLMKEFLADYAKMAMCKSVKYENGFL